jgi:mannose-1-phosphate guanylyltransferase
MRVAKQRMADHIVPSHLQVEKPNEFLSETVNGGIYLFSSTIFDEIKSAMDNKVKLLAEDPTQPSDDQLRLEQDVIAPLCHAKKIYVFQSTSPWVQIKSAASAIPANALFLASYKTTNPSLLRRRSPTIIAESRAAAAAKSAASRKGPEIVEPCFIDETAIVSTTVPLRPFMNALR